MMVVAVLLFASLGAEAQSRGGRRSGPGTGNPDEHIVPWKFLQAEEILHERPVTLYWVPRSLEEAERSPLMTSPLLLDAYSRCVDLEVVLPEQAAVFAKAQIAVQAPAALVVDRQGKVIRRIDNVRELKQKDVEQMLSAELSARDDAMFREMTEAGQQEKAGNNAAAIDLYKKIWDDHCLFSVAGAEAQRALKRLGVIVKETPVPPPVNPALKPSRPSTSH
jgi:hypothetical protein